MVFWKLERDPRVKTGFLLGTLLLAALLLGCQSTNQTSNQAANPPRAAVSIIPAPASVVSGQGHYTVTAATQVLCAGKEADCAWVARYFADLLKRSRGLQLHAGTGEQSGAISLRLSAGMAPQAYRLDVTPG